MPLHYFPYEIGCLPRPAFTITTEFLPMLMQQLQLQHSSLFAPGLQGTHTNSCSP